MKIAMYYPAERDKIFCKHTEHEFMFQTCDSSVDFIYVSSISRLDDGIRAKQKFGKPLICWCWDIPDNWREWEMSPQGFQENSHRDSVNANRVRQLRECDLIITASKWVQTSIKEKYNLDSIQLYSFIDIDGLDLIPEQEKTDSIIQISRFFYNKKFHNTVIATAGLNHEVNLFGTGISGGYGNEIRKAMAETKNQVNIHDTVPRGEIMTALKKSKLLVSPSVFEGWGITPVEALYCGVPILLSDLPVFKEVYGDNIIYHKRNDPQDMKEKLEMILNDETLQRTIVENCQPIIKEFTPTKFAERWCEVINKHFSNG